jgi:hypothetical protein
MKICSNSECKQINPQPEEDFPLERDGKYTWRRGECTKCRSAKGKARREPKKAEYNAYMREWNKNHPEIVKSNVLKKIYQITLEQYNLMLISQNGTCAMCPRPPKKGGYLNVDHRHSCCPTRKSCGKCVRGLLCDGCNRALHVLETPELLAKANAYLAKYSK